MTSVPYLRRNLFEALAACGIFRQADPDVLSVVAESAQLVYFPRRHCVYAQGDQGDSLYLIASGKVKLTYRCSAGSELIVTVVGPGDVFGEITAFDRGPREFAAVAVTEVRAIIMGRDQLMALARGFPEIGNQVMRLLARRADVLTSAMADFAFADPMHRLAGRLLLLSKQFGTRNGDVVRVEHDLTLEEISQFAGVAPETIGAKLRDLEERGWIRVRTGCLEIVDAHGLAALASER
jgi:CRP-like cAMP-binding protein